MLLLVGVVVGLAGLDALGAARQLEQARDDLQPALGGDLPVEELLSTVDRADAALADAERHLDRPAARVVAAVPLLGRSWTAERRVAEAGRTGLAAVRTVGEAAPDLRTDDGGLDLSRLQALSTALSTQAADAERALQELRDTPTGFTPPPVGRGVEDALQSLTPAVEALTTGATGAEVASSLLGADGPRSVLVALMNNAELRGAGGYVSTFATGSFTDGRLELEPFRDVEGVYDEPDQARRVPAPASYQEDYGPFLADTTNFRMWTMSPHVPDSAAVGAAIAGELLGQRPDVMVLLDTPGVAGLISLTGQAVVLEDGTEVPSEQLVERLLVDEYADAGESVAAQGQRRADLRAAAGTAAAQLIGADLDPLEAVVELKQLADARHLALWAADEQVQDRLVELGLAGAVDAGADDLAMVSVNNLTGNKLDYYVERQVEHEVVVGRDQAQVTQRVLLTNRAPDGLVPYVTGTRTPGRSALRVELSIGTSAGVDALTVDGEPAEGATRYDDRRGRTFTYLYLDQGQQVEVELRYRIPVVDGRYVLRAIPQALAADAALTVLATSPEERLADVPGFERTEDGGLRRSGAWSGSEVIELAFEQEEPGRWERVRDAVRRFWDEPVELG